MNDGNPELWAAWKASATRTRNRLARIIRNSDRLDHWTFHRLLTRIDVATARDRELQQRFVDSCYE